MRLALLALVVLAVVIPTALLPETATVYSVPQVLRAFRAEGLPLHPAAGEPPSFGQKLSGSRGQPISVYVIDPGRPRRFAFGWTGYPPKFAGRGNVEVVWTPGDAPRDEAARIQAALGELPPR